MIESTLPSEFEATNLKVYFSFRSRLDADLLCKHLKVDQLVKSLNLGAHHNTLKNTGVGGGEYDHNHRTLRQRWHQTTTKLMTTDHLHELVNFSARQLVENVEKEMKLKPSGIDPRRTFMNATLNVGSQFMLSDRLDFEDPEQVMIMNWIEVSS